LRKIIGWALPVVVGLGLTACGTTEDPASGDAPSGGEKITVTDSRGKDVVLDGPAKRIATTEWNSVEYLVSLGVQPVGISDIKGYEAWNTSVKLDGSATDIGTRGEPSIDTLNSLDLDLVVVTDELTGGALESIEEKTPVVVIRGGDVKDAVGSMWTNVDLMAKATGTQDKAKELRTKYDAKIQEGRTAITDAGKEGAKLAFSDAYVDAGTVNVRPFTKGALVTEVLTDLGLVNAWPMEGDAVYGLAKADVEGLTQLPDDVLFWYIANDAFGDPYTDVLKDNSIWQNLGFVKNGTVKRFPDGIWMFGGPESMMRLVDSAVEAVQA
jgi:ferric hydroxamate transport system substrate-binding protein